MFFSVGGKRLLSKKVTQIDGCCDSTSGRMFLKSILDYKNYKKYIFNNKKFHSKYFINIFKIYKKYILIIEKFFLDFY